MAWTTPKTFVANDPLTASELNTHLRDNMLATAAAVVTTQGDIVYASGNHALARLAVGTKGKVLQVNAAGTAPQWGIGSFIVAKTADESVSSSTSVQNDDHLLIALGANEFWVFELILIWGTGPSGSPKVAFSAPSGATGGYGMVARQGSSPDTYVIQALSSETELQTNNSNPSHNFIWGSVATSSSSGNLQLRWAQGSSSGNATVLKKGSILRATRVA
jgi:hypothetical protein